MNNPFGIAAPTLQQPRLLAWLVLPLSIVIATSSPVVRWRRAQREER